MATKTVPSPLEVELAEHKYGLFSSDLNDIEEAVERLLQPAMSYEEYFALDDDTRKAADANRPSPTVDDLAPLLVFAVELQSYARDLAERAEKLTASVMELVHQARDRSLRDEDSWSDYRARVAEWHAEAAGFYGATS